MTHPTSAEVERDAERTRDRVSSLLDELRSRVSPGEVVDQVYDYAREPGRDLLRTLSTQVRNNPLALALVGVGVGWLMLSDRRGRKGDGRWSGEDFADRTSELGHEWSDRTRRAGEDFAGRAGEALEGAGSAARRAYDSTAEGAARVRESVSDFGARASETASNAMATARDTAASATERLADGTAALRERAADLGERSRRSAAQVAEGGRQLLDQVQNQPLVLAGIGFALGAVIGASFRATETENRLMGETSDALKEGAAQFGREQMDRAAAAAADAGEHVIDEAERAGDEVGIVPPHGETSSEERDRASEPAGASRANESS